MPSRPLPFSLDRDPCATTRCRPSLTLATCLQQAPSPLRPSPWPKPSPPACPRLIRCSSPLSPLISPAVLLPTTSVLLPTTSPDQAAARRRLLPPCYHMPPSDPSSYPPTPPIKDAAKPHGPSHRRHSSMSLAVVSSPQPCRVIHRPRRLTTAGKTAASSPMVATRRHPCRNSSSHRKPSDPLLPPPLYLIEEWMAENQSDRRSTDGIRSDLIIRILA